MAIILAIFLSYWTWIYTWNKNWWKWLIGLGLTLFFGGIIVHFGVWLWAILDNSIKQQEWYTKYVM